VHSSRRTGERQARDPAPHRPRPRDPVVRKVAPGVVPRELLTPQTVLALQRSAGNRAVRELLVVQRGRVDNVRGKLTKERKRKDWKKKRRWPEQQLKGRILEVTDKYLIRSRGGGYVDMNKIAANFPAIDGIADGKFRQVKAYLHLGALNKKARAPTVARVIAEVEKLADKCEVAASRLTAKEGLLLKQLLDINAGRASTKGRRGKAPYLEADSSKAARLKHKGVLPEPFRKLADAQIVSYAKDPDRFDFDTDALATEMMKNMVVVVPDDLVADVRKAVASPVTVEGGGFSSAEVKGLMDETGYTPSTRGEDKDDDYTG
jgi:ferredoxin